MGMRYWRMLYIFAIIKRNHFKMYMFGVVEETYAHVYFEMISLYNSKDIYVTFSDVIWGASVAQSSKRRPPTTEVMDSNPVSSI